MEIIDAHQHFWRYNASKHSWISDDMEVLRADFLPPDLKKELDRAGVDGCIAVQADQSEEETDFLLELARKYSFIKGVVGWLDLRADDLEERLEHYTGNDYLKGIRHVIQDEPDDWFLLRAGFLRGVEKLREYNLCYDILIFARQLPVAVEFAARFPDHRFVVDHIAKPDIKEQKIVKWEEGIRELARHPKMYCKISGMVTEADWKNWKSEDFKPYLDVVFDAFSPERLMFGSDWPVCTLAVGYQEIYRLVRNYIGGLGPEEQAMILGGNAREFYGV